MPEQPLPAEYRVRTARGRSFRVGAGDAQTGRSATPAHGRDCPFRKLADSCRWPTRRSRRRTAVGLSRELTVAANSCRSSIKCRQRRRPLRAALRAIADLQGCPYQHPRSCVRAPALALPLDRASFASSRSPCSAGVPGRPHTSGSPLATAQHSSPKQGARSAHRYPGPLRTGLPHQGAARRLSVRDKAALRARRGRALAQCRRAGPFHPAAAMRRRTVDKDLHENVLS